MSDKLVLIASGTLTGTPGTVLFTNTAGEEVVVMQIDIQNNTGVAVTDVRMSKGADAAGTRIYHAGSTLAPNEPKQKFYSPGDPLTGTNAIQGSCGTNGAVTFAIWGTRRLV